MNNNTGQNITPESVLDFCFPDDGHHKSIETHKQFWTWRMQGHADEAICENFAELTKAAAKGQLDFWADTPKGRIALITALDQFPRSLWRDSPAAYGQDIKAARLAIKGLENGHYNALNHIWEKQFCLIAIAHCEGPEHLQRMERLIDEATKLVEIAPDHLSSFYQLGIEQNERVRDIISLYGRHPHRNSILGRISTPEEEAYIINGKFPHQRSLEEVD
jgi:uncharacterized protein (DUF924 family)